MYKISLRKPAIIGGRPIFKETIPITMPTIPAISKLRTEYCRVLKSRMITNAVKVQEFERRLGAYLGVKNAVAVNSCTAGLMLILKALKLNGEVIVPAFTFHATVAAAVWNGLRPVFVDCDPETFNISPAAVKKSITQKTSAIIAVHIFGNPTDITELQGIAEKNRLKLIFDAAHGFGSLYNGMNVGKFGEAESFSLSPTKLLTAGEGGVVSTNNDELARIIKIGRNYGDPGTYDSEFSGMNARMNEFSALLGIESLSILEENVKSRNRLAKLYKSLLGEIPGIYFQLIRKDNRSSFKDFSILINEKEFGMSRDALSLALGQENIVTKKYFYPPVNEQKAFAKSGQAWGDLKNTRQISRSILSLPLFSHMSEDTVKKICFSIHQIHKFAKVINERT